jgi:hypothetical protein
MIKHELVCVFITDGKRHEPEMQPKDNRHLQRVSYEP